MEEQTLRLSEIFFSIQGESTRAGEPCVFVRLAGCHLRCAYCDTEYTFGGGATRAIDDVLAEVMSHPTDLVEITGGEPLLQKRVHDLIRRLCDAGKTVLIETSGACDISVCDERAIRVMDLKTPGSGEAARNRLENIAHLTRRDEVKFVITGREDYDWAKSMMQRHGLAERCAAVLFSPVFEQPPGRQIAGASGLALRDLAEWILADGLDVRLQPQLHKFIWGPRKRGV